MNAAPLSIEADLPPGPASRSARKGPFTVGGVTYSAAADLATAYGIDPATFRRRLKSGWSMEEALGLRPRVSHQGPRAGRGRHERIEILVAGVRFPSIIAACRAHRVDRGVFDARRRSGWSIEQALELEQAPRTHTGAPIPVSVGGVHYPSLTQAARAHNLPSGRVYARIEAGYTLEQALGLAARPRSRVVTRPYGKQRVPKEDRNGARGVLIIGGERFVWKNAQP